MTETILPLPTDEEMYILDTDASDFGLGAVFPSNNSVSNELSYTPRNYEQSRTEL